MSTAIAFPAYSHSTDAGPIVGAAKRAAYSSSRKLSPFVVSLVCLAGNTTVDAKPMSAVSINESQIDTAKDFAVYRAKSFSGIEINASDNVIAKVRCLAAYDDGWHRDDSIAASAEAFTDAETFVRKIDWSLTEAPSITLSEDGEINLLWRNDQLYLDLGFWGDGTYSFFAKTSEGRTYLSDATFIDRDLPEQIQNLISIRA